MNTNKGDTQNGRRRRVGNVARSLGQRTLNIRENAFQRFPFLMITLSTFGLVAVLYSFERVIALVPALNNNPLLIFFMGVGALALTGTLYKKLQ